MSALWPSSGSRWQTMPPSSPAYEIAVTVCRGLTVITGCCVRRCAITEGDNSTSKGVAAFIAARSWLVFSGWSSIDSSEACRIRSSFAHWASWREHMLGVGINATAHFVSKSWGSQPRVRQERSHDRQAHQPAAPTPDRGHDGSPLPGGLPERLHPPRQELHGFSRAFAGQGDQRGPATVSTAYDEKPA